LETLCSTFPLSRRGVRLSGRHTATRTNSLDHRHTGAFVPWLTEKIVPLNRHQTIVVATYKRRCVASLPGQYVAAIQMIVVPFHPRETEMSERSSILYQRTIEQTEP